MTVPPLSGRHGPRRVKNPPGEKATRRRGRSRGRSPPRVKSNAPQSLPRKACDSRSEDFHTAEQWESNGIFKL